MQGINEYPTWKKRIFHTAYEAKRRRLETDGVYSHYLWDILVFRKIQNVLGGRVRVMLTGSAPISPKVMEFMGVYVLFELYYFS